MKQLSTMRVDDWSDFVKRHGIDLGCDCQRGCSHCNNRRIVWPTAGVAFDTGYNVTGEFPRVPYRGTVAFEYERRIWLAACCGPEQDSGPFLAMAWLSLFPRCGWLPEQFGDVASIRDIYATLAAEDAEKVVEKLKESLELALERSKAGLTQLEEFRRQQGG